MNILRSLTMTAVTAAAVLAPVVTHAGAAPADPVAPATPTTVAVTSTTAASATPATPAPTGDADVRAAFFEFLRRQRGEGADTPIAGGTTSPDGSYTVSFPSPPEESSLPAPLPDGTEIPITVLQLRTADRSYQTAFAEYPVGTAPDAATEVDSFLASAGGTLVSSEPVTRGGRAGLSFVGDIGGGTATLFGIVFVEGTRVWIVAVGGAGALTAEDPAVAGFLDSFQFTGGD